MPRVFYSSKALSDLDRLFDFLARHDPPAASTAAGGIMDAVDVLKRHPMIGRPIQGNLRELVISQGRFGYVAMYRFLPEKEQVEILAIRHQLEAGFQ
jgi:plasmid stabilization system protein ParE